MTLCDVSTGRPTLNMDSSPESELDAILDQLCDLETQIDRQLSITRVNNWKRMSRQDSIRSSSTSSSSGCISERTSDRNSDRYSDVSTPTSTPTLEPLAFEADFQVATIKRKPSAMQPKIPLTSTTRNLALQSDDSLVEVDSSSSDGEMGSNANVVCGTLKSGTLRRSATDERLKTRIYEPLAQRYHSNSNSSSTISDPIVNGNDAIASNSSLKLSDSSSPSLVSRHSFGDKYDDKFDDSLVDELPLPPPPQVLTASLSTLSLNSLPPPPPEALDSPDDSRNLSSNLSSNSTTPTALSPAGSLRRTPQSPQVPPKPKLLRRLSESASDRSEYVSQIKRNHFALKSFTMNGSDRKCLSGQSSPYDTLPRNRRGLIAKLMSKMTAQSTINSNSASAESPTSASHNRNVGELTMPFKQQQQNHSSNHVQTSKADNNHYQQRLSPPKLFCQPTHQQQHQQPVSPQANVPNLYQNSHQNSHQVSDEYRYGQNYGQPFQNYNQSNYYNNNVGDNSANMMPQQQQLYGNIGQQSIQSQQSYYAHSSPYCRDTPVQQLPLMSHQLPPVPAHQNWQHFPQHQPQHHPHHQHLHQQQLQTQQQCQQTAPQLAPHCQPYQHYHQHQRPQQLHLSQQYSDGAAVQPIYQSNYSGAQQTYTKSNHVDSSSRSPMKGPLPPPPEAFLREIQKVMEKKWKVAQTLSTDLNATPNQILGFRDAAYLPANGMVNGVANGVNGNDRIYDVVATATKPVKSVRIAAAMNGIAVNGKHKRRPPPPPPKRSDTTRLSQRQV